MHFLNPARTERMIFQILRFFPFKRKTVLFKSFGGQYNDNPKYVSERLHQLSPETRIVWVITNKCKEDLPQYIKQIPSEGLEYCYYAGRSNVIVDNITGIRGGIKGAYSKCFLWTMKSKTQLNIATWHGTPIKKIGLDTKEQKDRKYYLTSADYMISGCAYAQDHLSKAFYPLPIVNSGTPRNDVLINGLTRTTKDNIRKKLGLPFGKKIILFAPTFRDNVEYSGVIQIKAFDIERILSTLNGKFGTDWVFVFRVHHEVLKKIDIENLKKRNSERIYNGNLHDDMAEYLAISDALITDYSGSIFDFALTGKPGFLYVPDKEHYIKDERGTYISLDELPYPHADNIEDFYKLIEEYDAESAKRRIYEFNQKIGNAETGRASENLARQIIKFLETGDKEI